VIEIRGIERVSAAPREQRLGTPKQSGRMPFVQYRSAIGISPASAEFCDV
jgi:hypothetical protein